MLTMDISGESFNFSNEIQLNVLDLVRKISVLMGEDIEPVILNEASHEIKRQYLSAEKARRVLDWAPSYSIDEGLNETIAWYKDCLGDG
jgi:CDP-glucose 4,6-dehydratase